MAAVGAAFQGLRELEGVRADALENVLDALFGVAGEGGLPQVAEVLDAGAERGRVVSMLRLEGKKKVPKGYLDAFRRAERVFLYQRVYDPVQECLVHLTPLPEDEVLSCQWSEEDEANVSGCKLIVALVDERDRLVMYQLL